jgi:hypothetical protein
MNVSGKQDGIIAICQQIVLLAEIWLKNITKLYIEHSWVTCNYCSGGSFIYLHHSPLRIGLLVSCLALPETGVFSLEN